MEAASIVEGRDFLERTQDLVSVLLKLTVGFRRVWSLGFLGVGYGLGLRLTLEASGFEL